MAKFRFRRDTAVWDKNDDEISLMILHESKSGMLVSYLARCTWRDGKYRYAKVYWDGNAGQFQANSSFCGGFNGNAINYVARWYPRPSQVL